MVSVLRRFALWLLLTVPPAAAAGFVVTLLATDVTALNRTQTVVGGAVLGAALAAVGAIAATATTLLGRGALRRAGGSEFLTGAIVSYGAVALGLLLARLA